MLFVIQFPVIDLRIFIENTYKEPKPAWPIPRVREDFIRYFGGIKERKKGGVDGWLGEDLVCDAQNAIRFDQILNFEPLRGSKVYFKHAFKRFYFDGRVLGKFEVGIATTPCGSAMDDNVRAEFENVIQHLFNLPVRIANPLGAVINTKLYDAGEPLSSLYLQATSSKKTQDHYDSIPSWWVISGQPVCYVEITRPSTSRTSQFRTSRNQSLITSKSLLRPKLIEDSDKRSLYHMMIPSGEFVTPLFVVSQENFSKDVNARALRLYLLRLHTEHEALRVVLRSILEEQLVIEPYSYQSNLVQKYLNETTRRINKDDKKTAKILQEDVYDQALRSLIAANPIERDRLLQALEMVQMRPSIMGKVQDYISRYTYYVEKVIMGDNFEFSNISNSIINAKAKLDNVKQLITDSDISDNQTRQDLVKLFEDLKSDLDKVPEEQASDADEVASLSEKLVSSAKDKEDADIIELRGNKLKKAAENLASVAPSVLKIASQIVTLIQKHLYPPQNLPF